MTIRCLPICSVLRCLAFLAIHMTMSIMAGCSSYNYDPECIDFGPEAYQLARLYRVSSIPNRCKFIGFEDAHIGDADFDTAAPLLKKIQVRWLGLRGQAITDASIPSLLTLTDLGRIDVNGTKLTPAGISRFSELPRLRVVFVDSGQFMPEELSEVRRRLPGIEIVEGYARPAILKERQPESY